MNIDRIAYQKVFPIGSYATERIGLEATLDIGENPEEALTKLKTITNELHIATMFELEGYRGTSVREIGEQEQQVDKVPDELQDALDGIEKCQDMSELKNWWTLSKSNLKLSQAYKAKEKLLTDAK